MTEGLEKYRFADSAEAIYEFVWHKFADIYIEEVKSQKANGKNLEFVLRTSLKLLHPFMPFVTEAVWQELGEKEMLITQTWPDVDKL